VAYLISFVRENNMATKITDVNLRFKPRLVYEIHNFVRQKSRTLAEIYWHVRFDEPLAIGAHIRAMFATEVLSEDEHSRISSTCSSIEGVKTARGYYEA
jgi:hypothetical protein